MKKRLYLGIDVGGTFTKAALVNSCGKILSRTRIPSKNFSDKKNFGQVLQRTVSLLASEAVAHMSDIRGGCIGVPGPVDSDNGVVLSLTNIARWKNFPLTKFLKHYFDFPVYVENDANCMALAESRIGAARGASYALCLTLGTGVGGGIILDRQIYRGPFFLGGEVGHMPLSLTGPACECGGSACLEQYVGNKAILARVKKMFGKEIDLEEISRKAAAGNARALQIWKTTAQYLGQAVACIVNVLNPEVIVIGGGVSHAGRVLLDPLKSYVRQHAMRHLRPTLKIVPAMLGNDAGFLGAALLAKEKIEGQ